MGRSSWASIITSSPPLSTADISTGSCDNNQCRWFRRSALASASTTLRHRPRRAVILGLTGQSGATLHNGVAKGPGAGSPGRMRGGESILRCRSRHFCCNQHIADATNRFEDSRLAWVVVELYSQTRDLHVYGAGERVLGSAPGQLEQLFPSDNLTCPLGQGGKQCELAARGVRKSIAMILPRNREEMELGKAATSEQSGRQCYQ